MRDLSRAFALLLALVAGEACTSPPPGPTAETACRQLLAANPHEWLDRLAVVQPFGAPAAALLVRMLTADPTAPGAPAAVAWLGRTGGEGVVDWLRTCVRERADLGTEAALALGELRADAARADLLACTEDRLADPTQRTAAACALVRLGGAAAAAPLLGAVVLAGSPAGASAGRALGLPTRPRWALERYLVQRLLQQEGAAELALALDPDASWPELERVNARVQQWLAAR